jgi:hypothetical protein
MPMRASISWDFGISGRMTNLVSRHPFRLSLPMSARKSTPYTPGVGSLDPINPLIGRIPNAAIFALRTAISF